jgi:hypothetical protein
VNIVAVVGGGTMEVYMEKKIIMFREKLMLVAL